MRRVASSIAVVLISLAVCGQGVTVPPVLKTLVEESFVKYPRVAELNEAVRMGEVKVDVGRAGYLPVAGADLSYRRQYPTPSVQFPVGNGQFMDIRFQPANNYNASVSLVQPVIDLRTPVAVSKARSELVTTQDNLESFKLQLSYQVAQVYYSVIFLNRSINVQDEQVKVLKTTLDQIGVKVSNGDALAYDLVSTQVKYTNAGNFRTDLQAQLSKQYNLLGMLTGRTGTDYLTDTVVSQATFLLATDSIFALALRNNPDLRVAGDRIAAATWDIEAARRLRWPTMNLQAGLGYRNGFMPSIDEMMFNYSVGVGVTVPILPASRPGLQKQMAVISRNASILSLETQKVTLNRDMLNALDDIRKNQQKLASADTLIRQAQMAVDLASDRYKNGVITNLDLLTSIANYKDAQLSRLQSEYNLLLSRMELCRLAGINL